MSEARIGSMTRQDAAIALVAIGIGLLVYGLSGGYSTRAGWMPVFPTESRLLLFAGTVSTVIGAMLRRK